MPSSPPRRFGVLLRSEEGAVLSGLGRCRGCSRAGCPNTCCYGLRELRQRTGILDLYNRRAFASHGQLRVVLKRAAKQVCEGERHGQLTTLFPGPIPTH